MTPQHFLVPLDFSGYSTQALDYAMELAHKLQARLTLLHVIQSLEFIPIKPSAATESAVPGSCAGHSRVPSPDRGYHPSTSGSGLSRSDNASRYC